MSETTEPNFIALPDGRTLAWEEIGAPDGAPVLSLHGSPGCRLSRYSSPQDLVEHNIRMITYDRPGYGSSTTLADRTIGDVVADIEAILDAAGIDRVAVVGASGGGAHALACATLIPERVTVAHSYVGVAPYFLFEDKDAWFEGMDAANIARFRACLGTRDEAHAVFAPAIDAKLAAMEQDPLALYADMKLPEVDRKLQLENQHTIVRTHRESFRTGYWGFVDDFVAHVRDWGFDPRDAKAPVIVEYGIHDVNVPAGHGRWLAENVPSVQVVVNEGAGHYSPKSEQLIRFQNLAAY